jgi:uroporphyrinogen-III decarboxylase
MYYLFFEGDVKMNNPGKNIDYGKTTKQLFNERAKRLQDAMTLKQPDRIPIQLPMSYLLAEMGGITNQEFLENQTKAQELLEKAALAFQPDAITGTMPADSRPYVLLGDRMTRWPGHGLGPNGQYQFVENEFMKAADYDDFLEDPSDWAVRVYLPRAFKALEGFSFLPPLGMNLFGSYNVMGAGSLSNPTILSSFRAYYKAIKILDKDSVTAVKNMKRLAALGFPPSTLAGYNIEAPFDFMSDTLRGMRGIMLDVLQRPDKLLAAEEKVSRIQLKYALESSRASGIKQVFIPLHRGSDGFLSIAQFERFYWPQLKNLMLSLIDNGFTCGVFYEGIWNQRLKYITELPKGKTFGWFQASDIFKVKEIVGDTMCVIGGMPNSLLQGGTVNEVREYTRKLCKVVGNGGGYIMSVGVGEMSGCKPALVKAWVDATKEYGVY